MIQPLRIMNWPLLMKLNVYLYYDSAAPLLSNHLKENGKERLARECSKPF